MHCPFRVHVKPYDLRVFPGVVSKLALMPVYSILHLDTEEPWCTLWVFLILPNKKYITLPTLQHRNDYEFMETSLKPRPISIVGTYHNFRTIDEKFIDIVKVPRKFPTVMETAVTGWVT